MQRMYSEAVPRLVHCKLVAYAALPNPDPRKSHPYMALEQLVGNEKRFKKVSSAESST